jgi:hypothetical protein
LNQRNYVELFIKTKPIAVSLVKTVYFCRMQKMLGKISVVLFCGLLIYNSLGYYLVLSAIKMAVRHQKWTQLSTIPESRLTHFTSLKSIKNSEIKQLNKHEVQVDGKLYDIVRIRDNGKTVTYSCLRDFKEESLISKTRLFNSKAQQMPFQNTARLIIEKIIKSCIVSDETIFNSESYPEYPINPIQASYSGPEINISPPPPKSIC